MMEEKLSEKAPETAKQIQDAKRCVNGPMELRLAAPGKEGRQHASPSRPTCGESGRRRENERNQTVEKLEPCESETLEWRAAT